MNGIINAFILLFCVRGLSALVELAKKDSDLFNENGRFEESVEAGQNGENKIPMNSTVHMSVNHYYCMVPKFEGSLEILYGTKSWTFPAQDVNLTLSYPTANTAVEFSAEEDYFITGFKVTLYIDGIESKGYITRGGVLQDNLALTFLSRNITALSYQFWLYGAPRRQLSPEIELNTTFLCH